MKVKLKDVANISAGQGAPQGDSSYSENGIPFVKAGDLLDLLKGKPIINIQKVTEDIARKYKLKLYSKGTVLFAKSGMSCLKGYVYTLPSNAYVVSHLACITPNIDISKFLQYYFNYYKPNQLVKDKSYPSISLTDIGNMMIDLKTPEKRILIVTVLDKVSDLIALRKKQLAKLDELVKARFVEMFGDCKINPKKWRICNLEDIAQVGSSKRVFVEELKKTGIPFYRGTEVGMLAEGKDIIPELFITQEHYEELSQACGKPKIGDLLMPSICPDGRIWIVDSVEPFYFKDGRVLWVHDIDKRFNPVFLLHTLKERIMIDYNSIASGTTFSEIKIFSLKKCKVFDVCIEIQNRFADFAEQVDKQKMIVKQSLEKLETLKKSLMQEYFG